MKTLVIFMGPAGVGKTKLVNYLTTKHPQAAVITTKNINSKQHYYNTINKYLSRKKYVIVDGHNVFKKERQEMFNNIDIDDVYVIGV